MHHYLEPYTFSRLADLFDDIIQTITCIDLINYIVTVNSHSYAWHTIPSDRRDDADLAVN